MNIILMRILIILLFSLGIISCKDNLETVQKITSQGVITDKNPTNPLQISGYGADNTVVFIFVRHAEKIMDNSENPALTEDGHNRAKKLAAILANAGIYRVAYTNTLRAAQTAQPTIDASKCGSDVYTKTAWDAYFMNCLDAYKGKVVLVVGHSNTIHDMLNSIVGENRYKEMDEKDYENIYVASVIDKGNARVLHFAY